MLAEAEQDWMRVCWSYPPRLETLNCSLAGLISSRPSAQGDFMATCNPAAEA